MHSNGHDMLQTHLCVVQAFDLQDLREVAVKLHQLSSSWSDVKKASYVKHAVREYKIHRQLRSGNPALVLCVGDGSWLQDV